MTLYSGFSEEINEEIWMWRKRFLKQQEGLEDKKREKIVHACFLSTPFKALVKEGPEKTYQWYLDNHYEI